MMAVSQVPMLRGELRHNELLSGHTTWRVGGPARDFYRPADAQDLGVFLSTLPAHEPLLWLGLGSNLLVRDGGFDGTVIAMSGRLNQITITDHQLQVGSGAACAKVARQAARAGLSGAGFLAGIPGTMGGALAMNAGAFGGETWDLVQHVEVVDRSGRLSQCEPTQYQVSYRQVLRPVEHWFVGCCLALQPGDADVEQQHIRGLLARRAEGQPSGQPSGGSTFRNPPGDYAARLIEASGLKGYQLGGAQVSPKHANFIINTGQASAADIEQLIAYLQGCVEQQHGVRLQTEVVIVGEHA